MFNNMVTPYTNRLFNAVVGAGLRLSVVSCAGSEPNRDWGNTIEVQYPHFVLPGRAFGFSNKSRFAHLNQRIFRTLDGLRPTRLVINGIQPSMLIAAIWAALRGVELAFSTDGWRQTMPTSPMHRLVRKWVFRQARRFAVCGEKGREYLLSSGVREEAVHVVPLVPAWSPAMPAQEPEFDLLWVGHLTQVPKNALFFADLCVDVCRQRGALSVRVVGRGDMLDEVRERLGRGGVTVRYDSYVPWTQMEQVYRSARMLLLPSTWEAWGLAVNEAMQCGLPVVVSPFAGAADDLVQDGVNGRVVPLEIERWRDAVIEVLADTRTARRYSAAALDSLASRNSANSLERFVAFAYSADSAR